MPEVLLTFTDGEVIAAESDLIDFSRPVLNLVSAEPGGNNRELTVPLSSVKYIIFGGEEELDEAEEQLGKVVIHFTDHEVMRAYAGRSTLGGPLGVIYTLVDPRRQVRRRIGVPYSSVKAIFKVRRWDSRDKAKTLTAENVAGILAQREDTARAKRAGKPASKRRPQPLLDRTRGS